MHRNPRARRHADARAGGLDGAGQFVPHRQGQVGHHELVAVRPFIGMDVAAADADRLDPHQHLARTWKAGFWNVFQFQAEPGLRLAERQHAQNGSG